MSKIKGFIVFIAAFNITTKLWAGNVKCMGIALSHVLEHFENARTSTGVVALKGPGESFGEINLGYVEEETVSIRDIGKDSFEVKIHFNSPIHEYKEAQLKTAVDLANIEDCSFYPQEKIIYRLFIKK